MPTEQSRRRRRRLSGLLAVLVLAAVIVGGLVVVFDRGVGPLPDPEGCTASVGGVVVALDTEQAENAATISAVAVRRGMPARAASIALATAFQESKLRNLDHGDRDSVGLFQQRPSQGWGTAKQIQDPYYAINKFYDELQKIDGYQLMRITEAAQKVQRSGYPEAYEVHAADGRALASALTGYSAASFSCVVHAGTGVAAQRAGADGLTPRAERVRREVKRAFGDVTTGHLDGSALDKGRGFDVLVRPVSTGNRRTGWAIASYLVAHASRLKVAQVIFDGRVWTAGARSERGWRTYGPGSHADHVHVSVVAGS